VRKISGVLQTIHYFRLSYTTSDLMYLYYFIVAMRQETCCDVTAYYRASLCDGCLFSTSLFYFYFHKLSKFILMFVDSRLGLCVSGSSMKMQQPSVHQKLGVEASVRSFSENDCPGFEMQQKSTHSHFLHEYVGHAAQTCATRDAACHFQQC